MKKKPDIFYVGILFLLASGVGLILASRMPDKNIRNMSTLLLSLGALTLAVGLLEIVRRYNRQKSNDGQSTIE
jgi:hypothetical protein